MKRKIFLIILICYTSILTIIVGGFALLSAIDLITVTVKENKLSSEVYIPTDEEIRTFVDFRYENVSDAEMELGKLEMEQSIKSGQSYENDKDFVVSRIKTALAIFTHDGEGKAEYAQVVRSSFEVILLDIERDKVDIWQAYAASRKIEFYVSGADMLEETFDNK